MRYYKLTENGRLLSIGTGRGGEEITEAEYREILGALRSRPQRQGKGFRLRTDLTWEEYDLPPEPEPPERETDLDDALAMLRELGVTL